MPVQSSGWTLSIDGVRLIVLRVSALAMFVDFKYFAGLALLGHFILILSSMLLGVLKFWH